MPTCLRRPYALRVCAAFLLTAACRLPAAGIAEPAEEPAVVAVRDALPAVVNINTERVIKRTVRDPYDDFYNQFFGGPASRPRTVQQKVQSLGSGFIIDPAGFIVTNEHVVARAADLKIAVTTADGKTHTARYITGSEESDLALLKIDTDAPLPYIDLARLSPNMLGETVLVLGNPLGYGTSVARGILSAKGRSISVENMEYKDLIQTDAAINPGNSGGPLIDISGKLIGISSVKMSFTPQGVPTQGMGFAIPASTVKEKVTLFKQIAAAKSKAPKHVESESQARKYFGLELQNLTKELSESFGYPAGSGVLVADVDPGSPAAEIGIKRGLVIAQLGGYQVTSSKQIEELLEPVSSGSEVDFTVGTVRRVRGQPQRQYQAITLTAR